MGWREWLGLGAAQRPGAAGERAAAEYLRRQGLRILARNVLCRPGEIDLVALEGNVLVFVEVRSRASEDFGTPEETVRRKKRRAIIKAARWFIRTRRLAGMPARFDVVAVVGDPDGKPEIRHHRAAFGWDG